MAYEPKPGSMSLFKNDRKEKDSHPDYRGDGMDLEGRPVWISAWLKETRDGKKFFSISLQPKEDRPQQGGFQDQRGGGWGGFSGRGAAPVAGRGRDDARVSFIEDSEIPFVSRESVW